MSEYENIWLLINEIDCEYFILISAMIILDDLEGAALILINAVYFKGNWAEKFDPTLTKPGPFYINDTTVKEVPMMFKSGKFNFGYIEEFNVQYVELPYKVYFK